MPRNLLRAGVLFALVGLAACGGGGSAGSRPVARPPVVVGPAPAPRTPVVTPTPRQDTCQTFCRHMMGCVTELAEPGLTVWNDVALTTPVLGALDACRVQHGDGCKPFVECIWDLKQAASARANGEG